MTARCHVDDGKLVRNLLFCECDQDPTRKSREWMIVQLQAHGCVSSNTLCHGRDDGARIIGRAKKSVQRKMSATADVRAREHARVRPRNTGTAKSFGL